MNPRLIFEISLSLAFSLYVLTRRKDPSVTLAWVLAFIFMPYLGSVLFLLIGYRTIRRKKRKKPTPAKRAHWGSPDEKRENDVVNTWPAGIQSVVRLAEHLTHFPVSTGNAVKLYNEAEASYAAMIRAIQMARHHVHLEYFVYQPDATGEYFREQLILKAKEGVECRVLVDAVGSRKLNDKFVQPMRDAGIQFAFFLPLRFRRPWGLHLRNHRKLLVIDGRKAFIGSQNIGDEYRHLRRQRMPWQDALMEVEGPAISQIQTIFTEDWAFTTQEELKGDLYFPQQTQAGEAALQTLPTGPDENERSLQLIVQTMIHSAQHRVVILTPYLVPSQALAMAIEGAARRGVQVSLLLPGKSDSPMTWYVGRSWYRYFLAAGVEIHENFERFVHAKIAVIDDDLALVGSANMDVRSFRINFENSLLIYGKEGTKQCRQMLESVEASSKQLLMEDVMHEPFYKKVAEGIFRLASPLL